MRRRLSLVAVALALLLGLGASPATALNSLELHPSSTAAGAGFAGKTLLPREAAAQDAAHWGGLGLVKAVATELGESRLSVGAWHDNLDPNDPTVFFSRDCGLFQINLAAQHVDGPEEFRLRTASLDPAVYLPVARANVDEANELYHQPWRRNGEWGIREWEPWVAYTSGWATFAGWWVWHQDAQGHPVGPWIATGRYLQQSIAGVVNYRLLIKRDLDRPRALTLARSYQRTFNVTGTLGIRDGIVAWTEIPAKPAAPPADGVGVRPRPNDGR